MDTPGPIRQLERAYRLFNDRRIDDLLALMSEEVEWPDVANHAALHGKESIRSYWSGQFGATDPRVTPVEFIEAGEDLVAVVDQQLLDLEGRPIAPRAVVFHRYSFDGDLIRRMVAFGDRDEATRI